MKFMQLTIVMYEWVKWKRSIKNCVCHKVGFCFSVHIIIITRRSINGAKPDNKTLETVELEYVHVHTCTCIQKADLTFFPLTTPVERGFALIIIIIIIIVII